MSSPNRCFDATINPRGALARKLYAATGLSASKLRRKRLTHQLSRNVVHRYSVVHSNKLFLTSLLHGSERYGLSYDRAAEAKCVCAYGRPWRKCNSYLVFDNGNGKVDSGDVFFVVDSYGNVAGGRLGDSSVTIEPSDPEEHPFCREKMEKPLQLSKLREAAERFMRNMKQNHFSSSFVDLSEYMDHMGRNINRK